MELRDLILFGSSNSEIFDYIFGDNPRYHPFWASGWTARGLRAEKTYDYVRTLAGGLSRESNVILNFGVSDIDISTGYKARKEGFYDLAAFLHEVADGILSLNVFLRGLGFNRITASFLFPPVAIGDDFFFPRFNFYPLPVTMRGRMIFDLADMVSREMETVNTLASLAVSSEFPVLHPKYMRRNVENHPDYIACQDVIWSQLAEIDGMISRRNPAHQKLYPHVGENINSAMAEGKARPRTVR
ncbi:hypothetical protein [Sphingobium vermicomposti]|uniref:SGNH/GDSL hydrolase family protein n=1 Tax=Sphingobium vermicomposti TaxID=529005 RepID=A0A846M4G5_9SPHN|nr:hypothetical protein [Sphingobium vermicomposti]NIJ15451.1 hypothetical protein [Sphingobium vermicomposti]